MVGQLSLADFVNFDVDDIIALLPEFYHAMLNVGLGNEAGGAGAGAGSHHKRPLLPGPQTRYQLCRDEARFILKKNLHSAIMCRKNIILHGSGKSFASYAGVIDQVKSAGFDPHVVCLDVPVDVAYARVHKRSNNGYGRDVPQDVIDAAARLVARNFRRLASRVPNAHLFDSIGLPPRLVWSKQRAQVVASDPDDELQRKFQL
jgi:predicted ABC-type ATPase